MTDECPFGVCDGTGFQYDEETNTAFDCRCRPQRVSQAKARSLSAVIPRRYRDVAFDRPPVTDMEPRRVIEEVRAFANRIDDHLDAGRGLWFMGPPGTGKTTLAMLVSKAALKTGRSVAIYSLPRLLNEIRDTHRAERSHVDLLDRLTEVDLLHIDDVGASAPPTGCSRSSTRSSTAATRTSARSSSPPTSPNATNSARSSRLGRSHG